MFDVDTIISYYGQDKADLSINGYARYVTSSSYIPYALLGVGMRFDMKDIAFKSDNAFLNVGLGVSIPVARVIEFAFEYMYKRYNGQIESTFTDLSGGLDFGSTPATTDSSHSILASLQYRF